MIYLIDDKKERQEKDYKWSKERFDKNQDVLKPIYSLEELQEKKVKVFTEAKVILYHESFIDKSILSKEAEKKRKELTDYAQRNNKYLVYFSGGSDTRTLERNIANIPDYILYQNLDVFIEAYKKDDLNLNYLLYGSDPKKEEKLKEKLLGLLQHTENEPAKKIEGKHLFLRPSNDFISTPILDTDNETLWEASDEYLSCFIEENLNKKNYFHSY
jgi:hypothetical protein